MCGDLEGMVNRERRFDQHVQRQCLGTRGIEGLDRSVHVFERLDLGHHQVAQAMTRPPCNGDQVTSESRVVDRMDPRADAHAWSGGERKFGDQCRMFRFAAHGRAVLAIERDVEDAGTKFRDHLGLQCEALAHARFDPAVVIADRQHDRAGLGAKQNLARMNN
jgi:hypothetical protein